MRPYPKGRGSCWFLLPQVLCPKSSIFLHFHHLFKSCISIFKAYHTNPPLPVSSRLISVPWTDPDHSCFTLVLPVMPGFIYKAGWPQSDLSLNTIVSDKPSLLPKLSYWHHLLPSDLLPMIRWSLFKFPAQYLLSAESLFLFTHSRNNC